MHVPYSLAPGQQALAERPDVVVDLIGDLDATLVRSLDATLARIDLLGRSVEVRLKHVGAVQPAGVAALTRTAAAQRLAGRRRRARASRHDRAQRDAGAELRLAGHT